MFAFSGRYLVAELLADVRAHHAQRFGRDVGRVRTHVGDVAGFVQALGDFHRALGAESQSARCGLLDGAGDEWSGGRLRLRFFSIERTTKYGHLSRRPMNAVMFFAGPLASGSSVVSTLSIKNPSNSAALRASSLLLTSNFLPDSSTNSATNAA